MLSFEFEGGDLVETFKRPVSMSCHFCPLVAKEDVFCPQAVEVVGKTPKVVFVGLAPAKEEIAAGRPFVGKSGQYLRSVLKEFGVTDYVLTNIVWCFATPDAPNFPQIAQLCSRHVLRVLQQLKPSLVVLLGEGTRLLEKELQEVGLRVVRIMHPAAVVRQPEREQEFRQQLQGALTGLRQGVTVTERFVSWEKVTDPNKLDEILKQARREGVVALDYEVQTTGASFDPRNELLSLAIAVPHAPVTYVLPLRETGLDAYRKFVTELAMDASIVKVCHNYIFEACYTYWGFGTLIKRPWADTLLMAYALDENRRDFSLKGLARELLGVADWSEPIKPYMKQNQMTAVPSTLLYAYNATDAFYTLQLYQVLQTLLDKDPDARRLLSSLLYKIAPVYAVVTLQGIAVDLDWLAQVEAQLEAALEEHLRQIRLIAQSVGMSDFNPASTPQLRELLYRRLGLPQLGVTPKGEISTREEILQQLVTLTKHPVLTHILQFREIQKYLSTYVVGIRKWVCSDGVVRPSWKLHGTVSGRITCVDPPMQTIPRSGDLARLVRGIFVPRPGYVLIEADFSTHELRVAAALAKDHHAREIFLAGRDIHTEVAAYLFGKGLDEVTKEERQVAKGIAFGLLYGMSPTTLADNLGVSEQEANIFVSRYFDLFPYVREWQKKIIAHVQFCKKTPPTPVGRVRRLAKELSQDDPSVRGHAFREAVNAPVQGYASDLCQLVAYELTLSFVARDKTIPPTTARLLFSIHDSIILEVQRDALGWALETLAAAVRKVETAQKLFVPLAMEYCVFPERWDVAEKQPLPLLGGA